MLSGLTALVVILSSVETLPSVAPYSALKKIPLLRFASFDPEPPSQHHPALVPLPGVSALCRPSYPPPFLKWAPACIPGLCSSYGVWLECSPSFFFFFKSNLSLEVWLTNLIFPDYIPSPSMARSSLPPVKLYVCQGEDSSPRSCLQHFLAL